MINKEIYHKDEFDRFNFERDYEETIEYLREHCHYNAEKKLHRRYLEWKQFGRTFTMEEHRSRLARLAIFLLEFEGVGFNMGNYASCFDGVRSKGILPSDVNECGTCCCFLGHAPFIFPKVISQMNDWGKYEVSMFYHIDESLELGVYPHFFSGGFDSDKIRCASRVMHYLEEEILYDNCSDISPVDCPSKENIISRLSVFLLDTDGHIKSKMKS